MAVVNIDKNNDDSSNSDHLAIDVEMVSPRVEEDDGEKKVYRIIWPSTGNTAGAGAVKTAGAGAIITAGAGSVSLSGGTGGGAVNTSGAGCVNTYSGVPEAADNDDEEEDFAKKIPWAVGVLGGLADAAAIAAAVHKSPRGAAAHGGEVAYRVGLLGVFAAGVVEMVAAYWVSRDKNRSRPTGKRIMYVSICTLLLGMALDGVAIALKK